MTVEPVRAQAGAATSIGLTRGICDATTLARGVCAVVAALLPGGVGLACGAAACRDRVLAGPGPWLSVSRGFVRGKCRQSHRLGHRRGWGAQPMDGPSP